MYVKAWLVEWTALNLNLNKVKLYNKHNYTHVTIAPLSGRTHTTLATGKFTTDRAMRCWAFDASLNF